jgi:hypothetical protein
VCDGGPELLLEAWVVSSIGGAPGDVLLVLRERGACRDCRSAFFSLLLWQRRRVRAPGISQRK